MQALALVLSLLLLVTPAFAAAPHPWQITTGADTVSIHGPLTAANGQAYELSRLYYDSASRRFLLDLILRGPAPARGFYIITPETGKSGWAAVTRKDLDAKTVLTLPPSGTSIFLNSQLLRATRTQTIRQPYGDHEVVLRQSENPYSKKTFFTRGGVAAASEQTFGDGNIYWEVRNGRHDKIFNLQVDYDDNSADYAGYWSPDGVFLFMITPDSRFVVAGPYPTNAIDIVLKSELDTRRQLDADEVARDDRAAAGSITPEERYGRAYASLVNKITRCGSVLWTTGDFTALRLRNPGAAFGFGYPKPVGKRLVFEYAAEKGSGLLYANIITDAGAATGQYRDWLETVKTVDNKGSSYYALCP